MAKSQLHPWRSKSNKLCSLGISQILQTVITRSSMLRTDIVLSQLNELNELKVIPDRSLHWKDFVIIDFLKEG